MQRAEKAQKIPAKSIKKNSTIHILPVTMRKMQMVQEGKFDLLLLNEQYQDSGLPRDISMYLPLESFALC